MSVEPGGAAREEGGSAGKASAWQTVHSDLPSTLRAPRQARLTVRKALSSWGLGNLSDDAELLASELVANAAEHTNGSPIGLTIRQHTEPTGVRGVLCEVTDPDPAMPEPSVAESGDERGRGLHVVVALATDSGFTSSPRGKTAWFTLTAERERTRSRSADLGAEASA